MLATSFGLNRPIIMPNIYKNLKDVNIRPDDKPIQAQTDNQYLK